MKNEKDQEHEASTSREERFLRAWNDVHLVKDDRLRLRAALRLYEERVIMSEWDFETRDLRGKAIENPGENPGYVDIEEFLVNFSFE